MKLLITALIMFVCLCGSAQDMHENESDTMDWYEAPVIDSTVIWHLDTMTGVNKNNNSQLIINYLQSVMGTKVGDGMCGTLGERLCRATRLKEGAETKITLDQIKNLQAGDFITIPQFIEFLGPTGEAWGVTTQQHLCIFLGMKDDNTMLVAEQNAGGDTKNTKVQINEIRIDRMRFFKGNKQKPYFLVSRPY